MKKLAPDTMLERIKTYYLKEDTQLSEHDDKVRCRWLAAYSMLINQKGVEREVVMMLIKSALSLSEAFPADGFPYPK